MKPPALFKHQKQSIAFNKKTPAVFDMSCAGTGKTRVGVESFAARRKAGGGCLLVLCPKSLTYSAWKKDFAEYAPAMRCIVAEAKNRTEAFEADVDVYITNHDAVNWLAKQKPAFFKKFETLEIDECFPTGTLVDTATGPLPIESVKCGCLVHTTDGILPVTRTFARIANQLVTMELSDGTKITCTPEHPVATSNGWTKAASTTGMYLLRLAIPTEKLQTPLLRTPLRPESYVGKLVRRTKSARARQVCRSTTREAQLERRYPMPSRDTRQIKCYRKSFRAQTQSTRWQWTHRSMRSNDARNAPRILGVSARSVYWKNKRLGVSVQLQAGLRSPMQKMGFGSRRQYAHSAKKLGCQERFLAGYTRVVRVSCDERPSKSMVYNIQVDGPHNYSVAGHLVHNCTAFKTPTSQRSKAMVKVRKNFARVRLSSATPNSNGICNLWHQMFILDGGKRLGTSYFGFRSSCCKPTMHGAFTKWEDKPGIESIVGALIKDVVIRHKFEDCVDIPANHKYAVTYKLNKQHMAHYKQMEDDQILGMGTKIVTAVNAASVYSKLLQIASGAVYSSDDYALVDSGRTELVIDLVEARAHSIVFFQWKHQRDELIAEAKRRKISFATYDGDVNDANREAAVNAFQRGELQVLFAHPQSAGHGLTLTRGTATIWASPTHNLEHFAQGWKRVHRIGQKEKTETIVVVAEDTIDERVWEVLQRKEVNMTDLLQELKELQNGR